MLVVEGAPNVGAQPWNGVLFPAVDSDWRYVETMTAQLAQSIPSLGRVCDLVAGQAQQMPLQGWRGPHLLDPVPSVLAEPDPENSIEWITGQTIRDWLVHGNAVGYVTSRDPFTGWPRTWSWVPAEWVTATRERGEPVRYWILGEEVPAGDVLHVKRGAQPNAPWIGRGLVEQYTRTLRRFVDQEVYEGSVLNGAAVPSVAVISPNPDPTQDEIDRARSAWRRKYGGPSREPGIFPSGTSVVPLSWSPADSELSEARKLSLTDAGNLANIDGYWLGASSTGYSYKSPGPMYLNLIRQTVGPILVQVEAVWSRMLLPRGTLARFDRFAAMRDDMGTTIGWVAQGVKEGLFTLPEARGYLGMSGDVPDELIERWEARGRAQALGLAAASGATASEDNDDDNDDDNTTQEVKP